MRVSSIGPLCPFCGEEIGDRHTCDDPIDHIRQMHAVEPRGPWGIIAQESITILLAEIDRLQLGGSDYV